MDPDPSGQAWDDFVQSFQIESHSARGRFVRIGSLVDSVTARHDYPLPVAAMLSELLALAAVVAGYEVARISRPAHCNAMDLGEYAVTHVLIRTELDWRITAVLPHDPERAPWTS